MRDETANVRFHRRVMVTVLGTYMTPEDAREQAIAWGVTYREQAMRGLDAFLREVRENFGITVSLGDLRREVYGLLFVDAAKLDADPLEGQEEPEAASAPAARAKPAPAPDKPASKPKADKPAAKKSATNGSQPRLPPPNEVFLCMVGAIARTCEAIDEDQWNRLSESVLREGGLHPAQRAVASDVARWLDEEAPMSTAHEPESLRDFLHRFYLALCKAHGPVQTDRVFAEAVAQAERDPAALKFAPRKLL